MGSGAGGGVCALLLRGVVEDEVVVDDVDDDGLVGLHLAFEQLARHLVEYLALYDALHRSGTHGGVVAHLGQATHRLVGGGDGDVVLLEHVGHGAELNADDVAYLALSEGLEHDNLVDTVEELGAYPLLEHFHNGLLGFVEFVGRGHRRTGEFLADDLTAHVRGHDDDGVLEVAGASLVVGQAAVFEHLEEDVEDVGVCLLDFVEEDDGVGFAADGLGELSGLVVTHISRRCPNKAADAVALLVFGHVDTDHHVLVVEEHLGQGACELGLADAGGAEEDEGADGALAVGEAGARAAHGVGDDGDGLVLADDAAVELVLEVEEAFALGLQHAGDGDAGPLADHFGNLLAVDLLVDECAGGLHLLELQLEVVDLLLGLLDAAVVAGAIGLLGLELVALDVLHLGLK